MTDDSTTASNEPPVLSAAVPAGYEPLPGYVLTPTVRPVRSKRLGQIAFLIAVVVFVGTIVVSVIIGLGAVPFTVQNAGGFHYNLDVGASDPTESALAVAGLVQLFLGTALGVSALVQGIVAVAQRRGRAFGVVAIVLAGLGPFVTAGVTLLTVALNLRR